ncbi:MAG: hypothetical protein IH852_09625 [Bacteroidetes bacterium]|nr:hypothetical protein [Bacteroidota bacterium]
MENLSSNGTSLFYDVNLKSIAKNRLLLTFKLLNSPLEKIVLGVFTRTNSGFFKYKHLNPEIIVSFSDYTNNTQRVDFLEEIEIYWTLIRKSRVDIGMCGYEPCKNYESPEFHLNN